MLIMYKVSVTLAQIQSSVKMTNSTVCYVISRFILLCYVCSDKSIKLRQFALSNTWWIMTIYF